MQYQAAKLRKLKDIAAERSVDAIVEGSLQRNGVRLLVQVQLIDVATDQHLWAQSYDRKVDDLFEVQSAISREVARAVKVQFTEPQRKLIDTAPSTSLEAYAEYQRAGNSTTAISTALQRCRNMSQGRSIPISRLPICCRPGCMCSAIRAFLN